MNYVVGTSRPASGCVFCTAYAEADDRTALVLVRRPCAFLILNAYPYSCGHLMAVVNRHIGTLGEATVEEVAGVMALVNMALSIVQAEYRPDGFNVGLNQGRVAGAGITDHLHVHVVPRWTGDTNFMSVVGDVRVLPEALATTWERLRGRCAG